MKAILRQKELELELAGQGKAVDKDFVNMIESNLECVEISDEIPESKAHIVKNPFRPMFSCVPEGRNFSFQDAKNHLISSGIKIKTPNVDRSPREIKEINQQKPRIISNSPFEKSRNKFVFVNVNKNGPPHSEADIVVRDSDGTLREANSHEFEKACEKTWNRNSPKNN